LLAGLEAAAIDAGQSATTVRGQVVKFADFREKRFHGFCWLHAIKLRATRSQFEYHYSIS
jgi:hypothetical protein